VKLFAVALSVALLALGLWLWLGGSSDERKVLARLDEFASAISKSAPEVPLTEMGNAQAAAKLVAERCELSLEVSNLSGSFSREELAGLALAARKHFNSISLSIHEPKVEVFKDGSAKASFSAMLIGKLSGGESVREARDVEATLKKLDGKWLFSEVRAKNSIER